MLAGIQTRVIMAFVVDSSGRVDLPTITIIQHGWTPDFDDAVCEYLVTAQFTWGPHPQRGPVVVPFDFDIRNGHAAKLPPVPDLKAFGEELKQLSPAQLDAWLAPRPHCWTK